MLGLISSDDIEALEEVRLTTDEVFDLEKGLKSERVKVVGLENELKKKEKLHADLEVKFKEVNQKLFDLEKNNKALLRDLFQAKSIATKMQNDDKQTHFYTGLPSYNTFTVLLSLLFHLCVKWEMLALDYQWLMN